MPSLQTTYLVVRIDDTFGVLGTSTVVPLSDYPTGARGRTLPDMKKRILAAFLWFYAGWYAGAIIAELVHISPLFGPLLGAVAAALVAGDPRHIIWKAKTAVDASATRQSATPEGA